MLFRRRRRKARVSSRFSVIYPYRGDYIEARVADISEGGMFIETKRPLPVGEKVELFTNYDVITRGVLKGRVVHTGESGMGVSFLDLGHRKDYVYELLTKQNMFNSRYLGIRRAGTFTPGMLRYRLKQMFSSSRSIRGR